MGSRLFFCLTCERRLYFLREGSLLAAVDPQRKGFVDVMDSESSCIPHNSWLDIANKSKDIC